MLTVDSPFLFTLLIVFIVVFVINFISQTYLMRKENYKIRWKSMSIIIVQTLLITLILEWM
ncbi:hypothetical protein SAMN05192559_101826 [Halobacillus karajensis]|uniref:Uncharacterized protein n=1 Tax=Halobacillus karajensis TaxID=195088 RepID=A0A059NYQ2_9BACI|nr:hypothetical protein BN982_00836 [Halobacillus karajensis]CDQ23366.1 hypothetical protein BN983_01592 [Halobacillus karajensis]CDQ26848.1 hypothetical protein BN981_01072 [Halobacillus karajensis]SEH49877.1 hypothetical protein SAMN05192559_101826 [Halobacillus karajensis]